jgi:type I restriction enzyme S subunit
MGALGASSYIGIISPAYAVYRPNHANEIVGEYIDGLLRSQPYISNIICHSTGLRASRLRLYPDDFFRLPLILPPPEEQRRIVESIRIETSEIITVIRRLEREIEILSEYRMRLTADVVTGKLDVREVATTLPDEPIEKMLEDDAEIMIDSEIADEELAG